MRPLSLSAVDSTALTVALLVHSQQHCLRTRRMDSEIKSTWYQDLHFSPSGRQPAFQLVSESLSEQAYYAVHQGLGISVSVIQQDEILPLSRRTIVRR